MNYTIEPMRIGDFEEALALWRESEGVGLTESDSRDNISFFLKQNPDLSQVARGEQGKIVGAVLCGHDGRRAWLYHLAVAAGHRRRGIGKSLIGACFAGLKSLGIQRCNIFVYADNVPGKAFWEGRGWKERIELRLMQKQTESGS